MRFSVFTAPHDVKVITGLNTNHAYPIFYKTFASGFLTVLGSTVQVTIPAATFLGLDLDNADNRLYIFKNEGQIEASLGEQDEKSQNRVRFFFTESVQLGS